MPLPPDTIVITGIGAVTPLGDDPEMIWQKLLHGKTAARKWDDLEQQQFRHTIACRIDSILCPPENRGKTMAIMAAKKALQQAALPVDESIGVFIGTTMGESAAFEQAAEGKPLDLHQYNGECFVNAIREHFHLRGQGVSYGNACAAGNYAIGGAVKAIRNNKCQVALAGGVEPFSKIALVGFSRSRSMTPELCRPFDQNRKGMQLGEAAVILYLEKYQSALRRGVTPFATVEALGLSSDAYHLTAPDPTGCGMRRAMEQALRLKGLRTSDAGWINAHGTGTGLSDAAEAKAIYGLFGTGVKVSSYKGAFGHSLGAATALGAFITAYGLYKQMLPLTTNHTETDREFKIDIVRENIPVQNLRWALNCGYAFGGHNSALLMGTAS
jgi:3-oxoacyl-[acyl-carrier-protein] synthase II